MSLPASAQSGECVICLTECVVRVTACGHQFCTPCLTRYAEVSRASSLTTAPQATALRAAALIADAERDARNAHAEVGI